KTVRGKRGAPAVARNQAAQAAGMSQACGCGKEKRPAIGPGSERTARGKRKAPAVVRNQERKLQG
ncbi:hypothetical protein, partial [Bacillus haynesii]|uniref:hypothetical protein n=1 Tax=Bacillus haynesii TaxID=1925021 RepID=UPI002281546D